MSRHPDASLLIRMQLDSGGNAPALATSGTWRSWSWLQQAKSDLMDIVTGLGIDESGTLALVARNRPQHVALFVAQLAARRPTSMIYSMQSGTGIAADVARLRPTVVAADAQDWSLELEAAAETVGAIGIRLIDAEKHAVTLHPRLVHPRNHGYERTHPAVAVELLSSGTTGMPKRVALRWRTVDRIVAESHTAYAGTDRRDSPLLLVQPMGSISGLVYIAPAVAHGQRIVLLEKFDVEGWSQAVRVNCPNRSSVPAAALRMILDAKVPQHALASLSVLVVGGSTLDADTRTQFEATYDIPVLTAYGATEFGGVIAHWTLPLYREWGSRKLESAGRAAEGVDLRTVDAATFLPLPPNRIGLLEARVARIGPDWIRTTDLARLDEEGFLFLVGRADRAINRGGFKVIPEEVECVLKSHPLVRDAAVIGIPESRLGEVPVAIVELQSDTIAPDVTALMDYARSRLLSYQMPVNIHVMPALPRNASMKVSIPDLQALFSGRNLNA